MRNILLFYMSTQLKVFPIEAHSVLSFFSDSYVFPLPPLAIWSIFCLFSFGAIRKIKKTKRGSHMPRQPWFSIKIKQFAHDFIQKCSITQQIRTAAAMCFINNSANLVTALPMNIDSNLSQITDDSYMLQATVTTNTPLIPKKKPKQKPCQR